jgi:hypothetical protein
MRRINSSSQFLLLFILFTALLISNCLPISTSTRSPAPTLSPITNPTKIPTDKPSPTKNPDLTHLTTNCVEVLDAPPKDVALRNSLVLSLSNTAREGYIFNLETEEKISLRIEPGNDNLIVSPNMQKIAFINYDAESLIIVDAGGKELETANGFNGHFSLIEWLDNENLAINKALDEETPFYNYSLLVFNTLTDAKKEINIEDFPNGKDYPKFGGYYGNVAPNAQLTKVIYPVQGDANPTSAYGDGYPIVLWDIKSNSETRRVYFGDSFLWSSDGTKLLIVAPIKFDEFINFTDDLPYQGGDEIFIMDDKGEIKRLTYLTTKYKESGYSASSWSPTEKFIAFDLYNINNPDFGLSILNVNTGEITNYCIHGSWGAIDWSPDENQIAFTQWDGFGSSKPKVYILDLEKNFAFKVGDDSIVAGWVINK